MKLTEQQASHLNVIFKARILNDIDEERTKQDMKWGEQNHDFPVYLAILMEEVGEASQAWLHANFHEDVMDADGLARSESLARHIRMEMVQVAAVAAAMIECGDRNGWWPEVTAWTA